jgi:hypothetical protein
MSDLTSKGDMAKFFKKIGRETGGDPVADRERADPSTRLGEGRQRSAPPPRTFQDGSPISDRTGQGTFRSPPHQVRETSSRGGEGYREAQGDLGRLRQLLAEAQQILDRLE